VLPTAASTGFGANDPLPAEPMIATVTCDDGAGEGAGVGAGEGAGVDDGVGALGDVPPHAVRVRVAAATADMKNGNRMTDI
jgi:hypothetical protein